MKQVFESLPPVPDHPRLEEEILQWWEDERVFEQLRDQNRGNEPWSFIDGPVTANKSLGVHTATVLLQIALVVPLGRMRQGHATGRYASHRPRQQF